ncbi:MAG: pimeloyl-ACP methyl ester esterase BioH [Gammaproteobacteria bacterium]|nr:pimeloyl-ACP methyl ester esterase BioH [Gammaproteobacteria bacterium]
MPSVKALRFSESPTDVPPVVMIHGWGLHSGVFDGVHQALDSQRRVWAPDLPGYANNPVQLAPYNLDGLAGHLARVCTQPAIWVGWSLGGLVALSLALRWPQLVRALVLVGTSPCFVCRPDWSAAMEQGTLDGFAHDLAYDFSGTLSRFLSLQTGTHEGSRQQLRQLRQQLSGQAPPHMQALQGGLEILGGTDLRHRLQEISVPVAVIQGERDRLVPPQAAKYLAASLPGAVLTLIPGAGHAPFLSHPQIFMDTLMKFLTQHDLSMGAC